VMRVEYMRSVNVVKTRARPRAHSRALTRASTGGQLQREHATWKRRRTRLDLLTLAALNAPVVIGPLRRASAASGMLLRAVKREAGVNPARPPPL
jgi:hypothetical protein